MRPQSEFLAVAELVFRLTRQPMSARQVIDYAKARGLLSDKVAGRTPEQTMKSKLSVHIRSHGPESPFIRTGPGRFYLRELLPPDHAEYMAPRFVPAPAREQVIVFPATLLDADRFQGLTTSWKRRYKSLMNSANLTAMARHEAESTEEYKQVLTYVLVVRGDGVLSYTRGMFNRVEDMLKGARCIGFGGHVTANDRSLFSTDMAGVIECARRELLEELDLSRVDRSQLESGLGLEVVGLLNDDSSDVGRRHFAVVLKYTVADDKWEPQNSEESITQLRWITPENSDSVRLHEFEYWSQLCFRNFFPHLLAASPGFRVVRRSGLRQPSVLCVVGGIGSGKTEVADVLHQRLGFEVVNSGRVLAALLRIPPVPETQREEFQTLAFEFISAPGGSDALAGAIAAEVGRVSSGRVLVDGVRQVETLVALRREMAPRRVGVVFVKSSPDLSYRLYAAREGMASDPMTFFRTVGAPVELQIDDLMREADAVVYNYFGKQKFRQAIVSMFETAEIAAERS